uniref:Uncharacterized protein n=1 Tax=Lepeophtheirus salmonis TaxID=72036 RepID=A0A0K2TSA7_LEPSM
MKILLFGIRSVLVVSINGQAFVVLEECKLCSIFSLLETHVI